jgi:hypothetical protein
MTTPTGIPALSRPEFFDGQHLDADDLNAIYDYHRELRWLHNRALHGWGVATGLVVGGQKGGSTVSVAAGYALDCNGHDIVLAETETLVVPSVAAAPSGGPQSYYVTASWVDDADLSPSETREGACGGAAGAVRRAERARLRFQDPATVGVSPDVFRRGIDVVLATIAVEDCVLAAAPSPAERRDAKPASRPTIAAGTTVAGSTPWSFYPGRPAQALGVRTLGDTSAAGFARTPAYSAQVVGNRRLSASGPTLDGFPQIVDATPAGFVLQLEMPRDLPLGSGTMNPASAFVASTLDTLSKALRWHVAWIGVEG